MTRQLRQLLFAAFGLGISTASVQAGWNGIANLTCNDGPIRRVLKQGCDEPAPRQQQSVEYETTSRYYEPVTVMKPERYEEPIDIKVTSYYWEPVQNYVRRSYYDPCSGKCQSVDVPRTSYVRREECSTQTRYLEKVRMVPVQQYREVTETRPKYTYYGPTQRKVGPLIDRAPVTEEFRSTPRLEMEKRPNDVYNPIVPPNVPSKSNKLDRIEKIESKKPTNPVDERYNALSTSLSKSSGAKLLGEVYTSDRETPAANAKIVFVSATDESDRLYATADKFGNFDVELPAGEWHVYAGPGNGKADLVGKLKANDGDRLQPKVALK